MAIPLGGLTNLGVSAFGLQFTDGSQGIFTATVGNAVPEPAAFGLLTMAAPHWKWFCGGRFLFAYACKRHAAKPHFLDLVPASALRQSRAYSKKTRGA